MPARPIASMTLATDQNCDAFGLSATARQFLALRDSTMARWEREVRYRVDGANALRSPILTNTLPAFLDNIAEALSPNHGRENATSATNAAAVHGGERARMTTFGPDELIHEYQILRESIAVEMAGKVNLKPDDWAIIDRSINLAVREAAREFVSTQDDLRRKLAAALSHDMRTPLSVVLNGAELINITADLSVAKRVASKITSSAERLRDMMTELLDALTSKGGDQLPLDIAAFDIAELAREVADEYQQPGVEITTRLETIQGYWCRGAMRRALENLINNALKYGAGPEVTIMATQTRGRLMLSVHNAGVPIPKGRHGAIFDYLTRDVLTPSTVGWGGVAFPS